MIKPVSLLVICALFFSPALLAQDPGILKEQANGQVTVASRLMQQGMAMVQTNPSVENKRTAIQLFIQAGQLFEQSAQVYQSLMPQYAAQSDVDNSLKAMENCINAIDQLKRSL